MPRGLAPCLTTSCRATDSVILTSCRAYASTVPKSDQLGPIHQDDHQSFRVRKKGRALPLPPILDPAVIADRSRWEQPKSRPNVETATPFQKKLRENPYGKLSLTVRQCKATNKLYPSDVMVALHARQHPETGDPWLLPVGLTASTKKLGLPYHFLSRYTLAKELSRKDEWRRGVYRRLSEALKNKGGKMVWREDMADLILSLTRQRLLGNLKWHFKRNGKLVACPSPRAEDIEGIDNVSCILYLGSLVTEADHVQKRAEEIEQATDQLAKAFVKKERDRLDPHRSKDITHHPPGWWRGPVVPLLHSRVRFPELNFKTSAWRDTEVAVYSLTDLLGEELVKELVTASKFEGERCIVLQRGRHNVPVELLLMQLQSYLAVPGP